ncbi:MAG: OmpH family outer membrane protein [Chlorobium sp.]|nr:MAG: OmpH family outer membrane protein [Chlorobium sp.]
MNHSKVLKKASGRIVMLAVLSIMLTAPQSFAATSTTQKVGVVDSGSILQRLPETKQAEALLQGTVAPLQQELERLNQDYQQSSAAYRQHFASMKKTARDQKEKELALTAQSLQKYNQDKFGPGGVVEKKQQELLAPIRKKVLGAIESIARQEGFEIVLEKNISLYVTPEYDLTYKVMNQLNIK